MQSQPKRNNRVVAAGNARSSALSNDSNSQGQNAADSKTVPEKSKNPVFLDRASPTDIADIAGVIEKLELTNFMCHASLALEFNPRINFIVGKNGSGKSAIMTAVMVVLGTKAFDTCRGKSLASFVKLGARQAKIVIYLANKGRYAYQPERYGDSIILTKIIPCKGSSKTLVRIVAEPRELTEIEETRDIRRHFLQAEPQSPEKGFRQILKPELQNIMTALKIILPNPFALMTQETMKTFLSSSNEEEMYELLKEGTGITDAIQIHQSLKEKLDGIKEESNILRRELENNKEELECEIEKKEILLKIQQREKHIKELEKEMMWATVVGEESALKVLQNQLQKHLNQKREKENQLRKIIEQQEGLRTELKGLVTEIQKWKSEMDAKRNDRTVIKEEVETCTSMVEAATRELQNIDRQMQVARADLKVLQKGIEKYNKHSMAEEVSRRLKQKEEVSKLQKDLSELAIVKDSINVDVVRIRDETRRNKAAVNEKRVEYNDAKSMYEIERSELDQSKKQSGSLPTVYGSKMNEFLKAIDKAKSQGRFKEKPIGPIGLHVRVKDPKWELAVESFLKSEFKNFFCDNNDDRLVLDALCKKIMPNYNLTTVCSKFVKTVHDVKKYKAKSDGNLVNFMDALDVPLPEVMNYLIDQRGIESILLCPTTQQALDLMMTVKNVPHNCIQMITTDGEQVYPAPLYRFYSSETTSITYLVKNKAEGVVTAERKLAEDAKRLTKLNEELTQLSRASQKLKTELAKANTKSKNAEEKELDLRRRIDTSREEEQEVSQDAFANLQEEIETCGMKIGELENERKGVVEKLTKAKADKSVKVEQLGKLAPDLRAIKTRLDACQEKKMNLENKLSAEGTKEVFLHKKIEEMGAKEANLQRDVEVQEVAVREAEAIASQSCPRVNTKRSVKTVKKLIQEELAFVSPANSGMENLDEVLDRITQLEKLKTTLTASVEKVETSHEELSVALFQRKSHYNNKIIMIFLQVAEMFRLFFDEQPFEGSLVFNHFNRQMSIKLNPKGKPECENRNPSGGERTYTTIAVILSVWERLRYPFFMLDEFDVFMDIWNRRLCSDLMTHMARERKRNQFIFLTPLSMDQKACEDITIFRLEDPRPKQAGEQENES